MKNETQMILTCMSTILETEISKKKFHLQVVVLLDMYQIQEIFIEFIFQKAQN